MTVCSDTVDCDDIVVFEIPGLSKDVLAVCECLVGILPPDCLCKADIITENY